MGDRSVNEIWEAALGELQIEVNKSNYRTWLAKTRGISQDNNTFTVGVPNAFVAAYLESNQRSLIEKVLTRIIGREITINFRNMVVDDNINSRNKLPLFNPKYTFGSFIVGDCNRLAYSAAMKIAEKPGGSFNPLFIYGESGLGKTHLLHAIGHTAKDRALKVICVSAEQFTNELMTAIRDRNTEEFRNKFRSCDVLLVDDIQFFSGKEQTKETFRHTFNELHNANRQIAVTCNTSPQFIPKIHEQLRSRFEWGLVTDLQSPDFETRLAILKSKAELLEEPISQETLEFMALQSNHNIRLIEGSLNRVVAYSRLVQEKPDPSLAAKALENLASKKNGETTTITASGIVEAVAASFNKTPSELRGRKRDGETALARQVAMYLIRQETDYSLSQIGKEMGGKSPATISHAYEKIANGINNDPHLKRKVFNTLQSLKV